MTKLLLSAGLTLMSAAGFAAVPLTLELRDGSKIELSPDNLQMKFAESSLLATFNGGEREIPIASIASFYFYETPVGIEETSSAVAPYVDLFSVDGRAAGRFPSLRDAEHVLPQGVYIVKSGLKTFKTIVR